MPSALINTTFTTLTRPANVTPYTALDAISDNGTAGSVTALEATVSGVNDAPMMISELLLDTNDTGLGNGVSIRAYLYNSDPTANSGVVGGDNAAFSNKKAGFVATFVGTFKLFSDGGKAVLAPEDTGSYAIMNPSAGGKKLWIQYQAVGGFTPSANSTTIDARIKGFQGHA
jgi:hypothetical protein